MSLDEDLRGALHSHAEEAPTGTELLAGVRRRSSRLAARRRAMATTVAVVAAVVLAAIPGVLLRPGSGPTTPSGPAEVELVRPSNAVPAFPLQPTSLPFWVGARSFTYATTDQGSVDRALNYEATYPGPRDLNVLVSSLRWDVDLGNDQETSHAATVGGRDATVRVQEHGIQEYGSAGRSIAVAWQLDTGEWAQVRASGPVTEAEVLQVANGLTVAPIKITAPFTFELLPRDATLAMMNPSIMQFRTGTGLLGVALEPVTQPSGTTGVDVNGQPATARQAGGQTELFVELSGNRMLHLTAGDGTGLAVVDLVVVAEGIALDPAAVVSPPAR